MSPLFWKEQQEGQRRGLCGGIDLSKSFQDGMLTALLMDASKKHKSFFKFKNMKGLNYFWRYQSPEVYFIRNSFTKCLYGKYLHRSHTLQSLPNTSKIHQVNASWIMRSSSFMLFCLLCAWYWVWTGTLSKANTPLPAHKHTHTHTHALSSASWLLGNLRQNDFPNGMI